MPETSVDHVPKPASDDVMRFDVEIGGVRLLLPAAMPCEYFPQAVVYPVPRAPRRLLGMMHMRGHPVPVFDTHVQTADLLPIVQRCEFVVLRASQDAVGLICDRPPGAVSLLGEISEAVVPATPFAAALRHAYRVTDEESGPEGAGLGLVWSFDVDALIEACLSENEPTEEVANHG